MEIVQQIEMPVQFMYLKKKNFFREFQLNFTFFQGQNDIFQSESRSFYRVYLFKIALDMQDLPVTGYEPGTYYLLQKRLIRSATPSHIEVSNIVNYL